MPTQLQIENLSKRIREYKNRYLKKSYSELDESGTRLMINSFLADVLEYVELQDIKTEYRIRGEYADYIIQLNRKKHFVVEVKAIQLDLSEKHLRQSLAYAANEGIDWIILTNGKQLQLYKVLFKKPIDVQQIFSLDLSDLKELKTASRYLIYLTKKSVQKNELDHFWTRFSALEPSELSKSFYSIEIIRFLRRTLKKKTDLYFSENDILDSVYKIITTKINSVEPRTPIEIKCKKKHSEK